MTNKLTPEEIKKALECCEGESPNCSDCPANRYEAGKCFDIVKVQAVAVMNSQQAEIERLEGAVEMYEEERKYHFEISRKRIAEAIKEFAEKLKKKIGDSHFQNYGFAILEIQDLVKEMVGEE